MWIKLNLILILDNKTDVGNLFCTTSEILQNALMTIENLTLKSVFMDVILNINIFNSHFNSNLLKFKSV